MGKDAERERLKRMNDAIEAQRKKNQSPEAKAKREKKAVFWRRNGG